jgi:two-component system chemotaxis sensor kinase CheA
MLVFRTGGNRVQALPLSLVTRLEEVEAATFQQGAGRTLLHYRNRLVPVVPLGKTELRTDGLQPLIVVSNGERSAALAVDAIIDIVEASFKLEMVTAAERGVIGSAMIRDRATDIVDLAHYLPLDEPGWQGTGRADAGSGHILLVEASDFLREMLTPVLKASGRQVLTAADAAAALRLAKECAIGVALVDLDRDPEAAFDLMVALRGIETGLRPRILGLTALVTPELQVKAGQAGADDVHAKFDRRAVLAEINARASDLKDAA